MYSQDFINRAYQLGQLYLKKKSFNPTDMEDYLLINKVPEDLAAEIIYNMEVDIKSKRTKTAKNRLFYGFAILLATAIIVIGFYLYNGEVFIILPGVLIVPGLGLVIAGAWELLED